MWGGGHTNQDPTFAMLVYQREIVLFSKSSWEAGHRFPPPPCCLAQGFETSELRRGGELGQQVLDVVLEIPSAAASASFQGIPGAF